jgi:HEAT repeat protein
LAGFSYRLDEDQLKVTKSHKSGSKKKARFSEDMIHECLMIMETGDIEDLFEIIPRIGVLRNARFKKPLLAFLDHKDIRRREFAAYGMGAMADHDFLDPLKKAFLKAKQLKGAGARELQVAIIEAIGSIGDDATVDFFLPTLKSCCATKAKTGSKGPDKIARQMSKWIIESIGAIAQQGGLRSLAAMLELTEHEDPEIQALAVSELSVAYWHHPNDISDAVLQKIYALTTNKSAIVAESALSALQNLADVGCHRAEALFGAEEEQE